MPFAFSPVTGLNDVEQFPDEDPLIRQHIQALLQQIPNYFQTVMNKLTVMTSRATNLTGDQVVALGFKPKFVKLHAVISNNLNYDSESSFDGTNHSTIFRYGNDGHVGTSATDIVLHSGSYRN